MGKRRTWLRSLGTIGIVAALSGCAPIERARSLFDSDDRDRLIVFADASLAPIVHPVTSDFEGANPHARLDISLRSSGEIMETLLGGTHFDAVLLGGDTFGVPLVEAGLIKIGTMRPIASNWLVIATPRGSALEVQSPQDLLRADVERIGIADWERSALGRYAFQSLDNLELWEPLADKRVKTKDERELVKKVRDGDVDAAILYSSSAAGDGPVMGQAPLPEQSHRPIIYYVGISQKTKYSIMRSQFSAYLISQRGQRHFESAGFRMLNLR